MINVRAMPALLPPQRVRHHRRRSHPSIHNFAGAVGITPRPSSQNKIDG